MSKGFRIFLSVAVVAAIVFSYFAYRWYTRTGGRAPEVLATIRNRKMHPEWNISAGSYCNDAMGVCPYWDMESDKPIQESGYCWFLEEGDSDVNEHMGIYFSLLWDQVKDCGINDEDELEDDHSRVAVASHVADAETSEGTLAVFDKGVAARGVPQRLLTDNGIALNPHRRGWVGQLAAHAASLGVEAITGKPYHPQTQGKNERFHQTLFRWLDKQPLAHTLQELQAQVDDFDRVYNTQRPHQGLPGRLMDRSRFGGHW